MAGTTEDIRQFLISKGESGVPDSATFAAKMQNPEYVDDVRKYMISVNEPGVPDSATFAKTYQTQPQQSVQDPLLANSDTNGQMQLEQEKSSDGVPYDPYEGMKSIAEKAGTAIKNYPGTAAAIGVTALFPEASPLTAGLISGGAFGAGEALNKVHPFTNDPNEWTTQPVADNAIDVGAKALSSGLLSGLGSWVTGSAGKFFGKPGADLAASKAEQATNKETVDAISKMRDAAKESAWNHNTVPSFSDPINSRSFGPVNPELLEANKQAERESLDKVKSYMMSKYPDRYKGFGLAYEPSDAEALAFWSKANSTPEARGLDLLGWTPNWAQSLGSAVARTWSPMDKLGTMLRNNYWVPAKGAAISDFVHGVAPVAVGSLPGTAKAMSDYIETH